MFGLVLEPFSAIGPSGTNDPNCTISGGMADYDQVPKSGLTEEKESVFIFGVIRVEYGK